MTVLELSAFIKELEEKFGVFAAAPVAAFAAAPVAAAESAEEEKTEFERFNISETEFKKELNNIRGDKKVKNQNPETAYETLEKYRRDLVSMVCGAAWRARTTPSS